jgi:hypothetical protein
MNIESQLRPHRKRLVIAAEAAIREATAADKPPEKTQLNRLISVCGEATCAEEIVNYLRYQANRSKPPWPVRFAEMVIAKIDEPLNAILTSQGQAPGDAQDRLRVAAWRLYAVFLARSFTYVNSLSSGNKGRDHERARR